MGMSKIRQVNSGIPIRDTRCVKPAPKAADAELLTPEHRAWRAAVLKRAGYRCEAVEAGVRCAVRAPSRLFADHIIERRDGGSPLDLSNGQCLCGSHHTRKTVAARTARLGLATDR